jgi:hypothetical protein
MFDTVFTPALVVFGIAIGTFLGCLECLWLRWPVSLDGAWPGVFLVALVNAAFIYLMVSIENSYYLLLIFPIPIIPLAYTGLKMLAYLAVPRAAGTGHSSWKTALLTLVFHTVVFLFSYAVFARINPTRSNLEAALRDNNNGLLEAMLWMSISVEPNMTRLVNDAIVAKNDDAVRRLLRHGADPEQEYWLDQASHETLWRMTKWMLDEGVTPQAFDRMSQRPRFADIALGYGKAELEYCVKKGFDPKKYPGVLHAAITGQRLRKNPAIQPDEIQSMKDKIVFLLDHGADINGNDDLHFAPLFTLLSVGVDLSPVLTLLIEKGVDMNRRTVNKMFASEGGELPPGMTALMLAVINKDYKYAAILVKSGADKTIKDDSGLAALDYARKGKADDATMRLLQ